MADGPSTSALADAIERNRSRIMARFVERVYDETAPASLPRDQLIDSLGEYLADLVAELRQQSGGVDHSSENPAVSHGRQRFGLGYDFAAVVREYGIVREVLFALAQRPETSATARELDVLSGFVLQSIGLSVQEYAKAKDEELRRQTSRHIAFLAHELRNPLSSMRLSFDVLRSQGSLPANDKAVAVLARGFDLLAELIDQVLIEVRLRDGAEVHLEELSLPEVVERLVDEVRPHADGRGVTIALELPERPCPIHADPKLLRSAIGNLVRNAVKFTRPGGTIRVRARQAAGRVLFEVQDECGGLPEGQVEKLFDPFVQTGRDRSGFGLGLAITKQVAEAHQGAVRVHNLPGVGCVFLLDIPAQPG